jgi:hypothetical protein
MHPIRPRWSVLSAVCCSALTTDHAAFCILHIRRHAHSYPSLAAIRGRPIRSASLPIPNHHTLTILSNRTTFLPTVVSSLSSSTHCPALSLHLALLLHSRPSLLLACGLGGRLSLPYGNVILPLCIRYPLHTPVWPSLVIATAIDLHKSSAARLYTIHDPIALPLEHLLPFERHTTTMTSITQLLSPWPTVTKQSIVLREHYLPPHHQDHMDTMSPHHTAPSPPNDLPADSTSGNPDSDGGENNADGRKGYGKRELSTSKRAAQNRAAQVRSIMTSYLVNANLFPESFPPEERGLHQEAGRASTGLPDLERELQAGPIGKLPIARLHHQPPVTSTRVARGGTPTSQQCRRSTTRQSRSATSSRHFTSIIRAWGRRKPAS